MTYIGFLLACLDPERTYTEAEQAQLEELFVECNGLLYGYIYRMTGDAEQALDYMQESFIRLLASGKRFTDKLHIKNYLFRIARNLCLSTFRGRRLKGQASVEKMEEKGFFFRDSGEDQARKLMREELDELLDRFIGSRPEKERTILTLKKLEGMTYEEIAGITGLSVRHLKRIVKAELDALADLFAGCGITALEDLA